ncbi:hypothetical protein L1987_07966 [Smallanthus sonchifolius]|uniref:Uncharacterized protein n=1 Tax=Smallanthus sonchifolius TaxID=185202 RepID=A0ACB9JIX1_9ASTR|nr:hypothetical protein L1987_07966 [Smallanthus sonchifolius]
MTSACINNPHIRLSPDNFFNFPPTYACLTPRLPLLGEMHEQDDSGTNRIPSPEKLSDLPEESDTDLSEIVDFEFRLEEPVNMLPADQLFSDGKLFPLHFPVVHQEAASTSSEVTDSSGVSLERSSSSPSSFNGGPRLKHRGMERSYSGNVRITPVLNVPVCSLRGFPLFSSSQKHEGSSNSNSNSNRGASNRQQMNNKSKTDRS